MKRILLVLLSFWFMGIAHAETGFKEYNTANDTILTLLDDGIQAGGTFADDVSDDEELLSIWISLYRYEDERRNKSYLDFLKQIKDRFTYQNLEGLAAYEKLFSIGTKHRYPGKFIENLKKAVGIYGSVNGVKFGGSKTKEDGRVLGPTVHDARRSAAEDGTRIASICSGTFPLAATGLLDGLRATTHWKAAELLAATHPDIEVDPDVLYVDNGQLLTSAGAAAGLDLCLHMIRRDYGSAVAADAARTSVMPLEREGGQAQFIVHPGTPVPRGSALEPLLTWLQDNLGRDLTLTDIAAHAGTSTRTLIRRFREQTGTTPLQWLHRARIRRAQHLLEATRHSVERIGTQVGFGSPTAFRDRFKKATGVSPHTYRRSFS